MVNIRCKRCIYNNCIKQPRFNYKGENKGLYCSEHKEENMVNIKDKKCNFNNCDYRTNYGFCGEEKIRCSKHKEENMFYNPKRKCSFNLCNILAIYGINEPSHCEEHKNPEERLLISSKCTNCDKLEILNKNKLCVLCEPLEYLENNVLFEKKKEKMVLNYLDNVSLPKDTIIKIIDDRTINTICNFYRPDRIYDCGSHLVIIEIDERQHKNKTFCESLYRNLNHSEETRMYHIQSAAGIPCIFLRFNPDNFRVNNILQKNNIEERLQVLSAWLFDCIKYKPDNYLTPVKYIKLFYDDYTPSNKDFILIDENTCII
jgi:hypothetical protein